MMSDKKKISTLEADKERLLDALRQLRKEGVTLIDDRVGRPAVISSQPRSSVESGGSGKNITPTENLILESLDRLFIEETASDNDPYNKSIK